MGTVDQLIWYDDSKHLISVSHTEKHTLVAVWDISKMFKFQPPSCPQRKNEVRFPATGKGLLKPAPCWARRGTATPFAFVAAALEEDTVSIMRTNNNTTPITKLPGHQGGVRYMEWSNTGYQIVTVCNALQRIRVWRLQQVTGRKEEPTQPIPEMVVLDWLKVEEEVRPLGHRERDKETEPQPMFPTPPKVLELVFGPLGDCVCVLATVAADETIGRHLGERVEKDDHEQFVLGIWDVLGQGKQRCISPLLEDVYDPRQHTRFLHFSRSGSYVAHLTTRLVVCVHRAANLALQCRLDITKQRLAPQMAALDAHSLAKEKKEEGTAAAPSNKHVVGVSGLRITPDEECVAVSMSDGSLRLWSIQFSESSDPDAGVGLKRRGSMVKLLSASDSGPLMVGHFERYESRREPLCALALLRATLGHGMPDLTIATAGPDGALLVFRVKKWPHRDASQKSITDKTADKTSDKPTDKTSDKGQDKAAVAHGR